MFGQCFAGSIWDFIRGSGKMLREEMIEEKVSRQDALLYLMQETAESPKNESVRKKD